MSFKPQLLPNNPAGTTPDWENLLTPVSDYLTSDKADGVRLVCFEDGSVVGRSLKKFKNVYVEEMVKSLQLLLQFQGILEGELYSPNLTFSEIMHFFRTEDVSAPSTRKKFQKEWEKTNGGTSTYKKTVGNTIVHQEWEFPGRDVDFLCTWPDCLKIYVFDHTFHGADERTKQERYYDLVDMFSKERIQSSINDYAILLKQTFYTHIDEVYQAYDQASISGYEGLVLIHKDSKYKHGRHTLNAKEAFKMKEDNLQFDGVILDLEEATEVLPGVEKTINELGRSVTSKLKDDRVPSGLCKGFKVRLDDGNEMTVSLKGFDHDARRAMLLTPEIYVGKTIRFTGMAPTKEGGCPRHAHFTKGNIRDDK
jgi:hypothetical protein